MLDSVTNSLVQSGGKSLPGDFTKVVVTRLLPNTTYEAKVGGVKRKKKIEKLRIMKKLASLLFFFFFFFCSSSSS